MVGFSKMVELPCEESVTNRDALSNFGRTVQQRDGLTDKRMDSGDLKYIIIVLPLVQNDHKKVRIY